MYLIDDIVLTVYKVHLFLHKWIIRKTTTQICFI